MRSQKNPHVTPGGSCREGCHSCQNKVKTHIGVGGGVGGGGCYGGGRKILHGGKIPTSQHYRLDSAVNRGLHPNIGH